MMHGHTYIKFKTRSYQAFSDSSIDFLLNIILICYLRSQIPVWFIT